MAFALAPGSRIIVRDEEWLVRKVDRTQSGAQLLTVTGLSPLVLNREAKFIDEIEPLEEFIQLVDPKQKLAGAINQRDKAVNRVERITGLLVPKR